MARTKYVNVTLAGAGTTHGNLMGGRVVGQYVEDGLTQLLLERPEAKPRAKSATRKPRTNVKAAASQATGAATAFPGAWVSSGA